jgi:hypothetical protein
MLLNIFRLCHLLSFTLVVISFSVFAANSQSIKQLNSSNGTFSAVQFGQAGDVPIAGDYDGDNKNDLIVFRNGIWFILQTSNNQFRAEHFG